MAENLKRELSGWHHPLESIDYEYIYSYVVVKAVKVLLGKFQIYKSKGI